MMTKIKKHTKTDRLGTSDMHSVVVFMSTPRCGTQWIAKNLNATYTKDVLAVHEPNGNQYKPKQNLRRYTRTKQPGDRSVLQHHLDFVEQVLPQKHYIEVGWQSIAVVGEFYRRFGKSLKLVHLYRNPVNVAASMVTHNWYTGKVKDRCRNAELTPFDSSAILNEYQDRWNTLTLFEKSVYYWTEVNLRALEIKYRYPELPFYSLKFEDLFKNQKACSRMALVELLAFLDLNYKPQMFDALNEQYDEYRYRTKTGINKKDIENHPQTIALGKKLGYAFDKKRDLSRYKQQSFLKKIAGYLALMLDFI